MIKMRGLPFRATENDIAEVLPCSSNIPIMLHCFSGLALWLTSLTSPSSSTRTADPAGMRRCPSGVSRWRGERCRRTKTTCRTDTLSCSMRGLCNVCVDCKNVMNNISD